MSEREVEKAVCVSAWGRGCGPRESGMDKKERWRGERESQRDSERENTRERGGGGRRRDDRRKKEVKSLRERNIETRRKHGGLRVRLRGEEVGVRDK